MRSKYNNRKTMVYGIEFDSKAEAKYYLKLRDREKRGEITDLKRQVAFELIPKQKVYVDGGWHTWRPCEYIADFVYYDTKDERIHVVDVKGKKTEVFRIKKKAMFYVNGIVVEEVRG